MRHILVAGLASVGFGLLVVPASADSGGSTAVTIPVAPPVDHLQVQAPAAVTAGAPFGLTVTAQDHANNPATGFRDTIHFTSSDPRAVLPPDYTFTGPGGDNGTHIFSLTLETAGVQTIIASDTSNSSISGSANIAVADAPVTATGIAVSATEGTTAVNATVADFSDADPLGLAADFSAMIDWGDGTSATTGTIGVSGTGGFVVSGSHTYAEEGGYVVTVQINDLGGSSASASATARVADAVLSASGATVSAVEGATFSGTVASFTDADPNGTAGDYTATITWGDGKTSTGTIAASVSGGFNVLGTNAYAEEGSYAISVKISDAGGASATVSSSATVGDAALSATGTSVSAVEGASSTKAVASVRDADPNGTASDYTATISWGDGNTSAGTLAPGGSGGFLVTGTHAYGEEGSYSVTVTITDAGGSSTTTSSTATVNDAALSATGAAISAVEGASFAGTVASFTDADPNGTAGDYAATIAWGDGSTAAGTIAANASGGFTVTGRHTYAEEGPYQVAVMVKDVGGSSTSTSDTASVTDAALTATPSGQITAYPFVSVAATLATVTDANPGGTLSDFTAGINWGDSSTSAGTVTAISGGFSVAGNHTYNAVGNYPITVTISDVGGSTATASLSARVIDFAFGAIQPINVTVGGTATTIVAVNSVNGFSAPVSLTVAGAPTGVTATVAPTQVTPPANGSVPATLTVALGPSVTPTTFTLTISGTSTPVSHMATVSVTVSATTSSISAVVAQLLADGAIDSSGVANALTSKLSAAQAAINRGDVTAAINILKAFMNQVQAQRGQHILASFMLNGVTFDPAQVLLIDAQSLIDQLQVNHIPDPITGTVVNTCGLALPGVTVSLEAAGATFATTTTDITGFYYFATTGMLTSGSSYTVAVTALPPGSASSTLPSQTFIWSASPVSIPTLVVS